MANEINESQFMQLMGKDEDKTPKELNEDQVMQIISSKPQRLASDGYGDVEVELTGDQPETKDLGTQPTTTLTASDKFGHGVMGIRKGVLQGYHWLGDKIQQPLNELFGTHFDTNEYKKLTDQATKEEAQYQEQRKAQGDTGTDWWSLAGETAATLPVGALAKGFQGAKILSGTGAKVLAQNAALGGAIGGLGYAENADQRLQNIGAGAVGGAIGSAAGAGLEKVATKATQKVVDKATQKVLDAPRNEITQQARDAGYIVPPSYSNPNFLNKTLSKIAGEADLGRIASSKNQDVTNRLAKKTIGLPENEPITKASLNKVREEAGQAYDIVNSLGKVKIDKQFIDKFNEILKPYSDMSNDFNLDVSNDVLRMLQTAMPKNGEFEASSALHAIRQLREQASKAYSAGDTSLGKATKGISEALELQLERALVQNTSVPRAALHNYINARKVIAKTYTIESALSEAGDVSASKLAAALGKGVPLESELKQAAQFSSTYPQINQFNVDGRHGGSGLGLFDGLIGLGGGAATGGTTGLALALTRPLLRQGLATKTAGKVAGNQSYRSRQLELLRQAGILSPYAPAVGANINKD